MNSKHLKNNSVSKGKPFYSQQHSHRSQSAMLINNPDDNINEKPETKRDSVAASSNKNITGALVDGYVVNQVML